MTPWCSRSHLRAIAPAATRTAVSRADWRPAAAIVADAVLLPVRVVGVPGAKRVCDIAVVLAARIDVANQQRDRRAGGRALEYAGEDFDRIGFLTLSDVARSAGTPAIEIVLNVRFAERQTRRATVDHATDRGPVAFAERGDAEQLAESVAGHVKPDV